MKQENITKSKILVVEDEEFLRQLYVFCLGEEGYDVDEAKDGEEAYQKISQQEYDLILLDFLLPKMDGFQILSKLKTEFPEKIQNKPIVILSNLDQDFLENKGLPVPVLGFIIKSEYTPDQFVQKVKQFLGKSKWPK